MYMYNSFSHKTVIYSVYSLQDVSYCQSPYFVTFLNQFKLL